MLACLAVVHKTEGTLLYWNVTGTQNLLTMFSRNPICAATVNGHEV